MVTRTGRKHRTTGAGFTLVELLLAVVIVLLLLGAVIFNFSGLQRGAGLDEGVTQVEGLIRFARAHAANTGFQVQLHLQSGSEPSPGTSNAGIRLTFEPDPVARPGILEPVLDAAEYVRGIPDLIRIESVRLGPEGEREKPPADPTMIPESGPETLTTVGEVRVSFYPDGSSDSAEILVASRAAEDHRQIRLQLQGVTGAIRRQRVDPAPENNTSEPTPPLPLAENAITSNPTRGNYGGR